MSNQDFYNSLSEEVKEKITQCKTQDEMRRVLTEAGVEPLDDELLDAVAGGYGAVWKDRTPAPVCKSYQVYLP